MTEQSTLNVRPLSSPLMLALSIALGAALGASVYIVAEIRHQKQQHVVPPSAAVTKPAPVEVAKAPAAPPQEQVPPAVVEAEPAPKPAAPLDPKAQALAARAAAEQALLEEARTQLGANNATAALATLDRMKKKFPRGSLVQDRELLRVEVYQARGQTPAAQRAARKFAKAYPDNPNLGEIASLLN